MVQVKAVETSFVNCRIPHSCIHTFKDFEIVPKFYGKVERIFAKNKPQTKTKLGQKRKMTPDIDIIDLRRKDTDMKGKFPRETLLIVRN